MDSLFLFSSDVETDTTEIEALLQTVLPTVLTAEGIEIPCEVDILFTDDAGIQSINREQRNIDSPTDVLSFPMFDLVPGEPPGSDKADPGTGRIALGDMVINLEQATRQGEEFGHGLRREAAYLAVHSMLHLLGYDHVDEGPQKAQMRAREESILESLGIPRFSPEG